ncbi:MAG: MBOAT family protein, partial [Clostridia bacterium]|nr:MBOAT family protein [Clostridia bacterium]
SVPLLNIALPIGISFYTFQLISYTIDVYRGEKAQKNPINLAAYITMFPQLIAGPIVRYSDIAHGLTERKHTLDGFASGATRFALGLAKKILIANALGELCDTFRTSDDKSVMFYWLYAVAYALHVYFDFSGYSDMAIGLGRIFGFEFMENFNYPFISSSATEFWRRWHISLGSWFRDYVYIPLGGNRVSAPRHLFNIFTVWLLTGFWHGAAWTFIAWGLFFAVLLTAEKFFLLRYLKKSKVISRVYILLAVLISFVIFNAADLREAGQYIGAMFGAGDFPAVSAEFFYYLRSYAVTLLLGVIGATPIVRNAVLKIKENKTGGKVIAAVQPVAVAALIAVATAYLVDGSFNPFLYFRF